MRIQQFKKGDIITRVKPSERYNTFGAEVSTFTDRSYVGDKLIFIGIANSLIYFRITDEFHIRHFGDKLHDLSLDLYEDGWEYYVDPYKLFDVVDIEPVKEEVVRECSKPKTLFNRLQECLWK